MIPARPDFYRSFTRILFASCLSLTLSFHAGADSPALVDFSTDEGLTRLARTAAKADFAALANQFEAQSNNIFCGPTTAAIVLNALYGRSSALPRERHRMRSEDLRHVPKEFDPSVARFTQDNVIERGKKTRAQVFGEPMNIAGKVMNDFGYQLRQFEEMLRANGAKARAVVVDEKKADDEVRAELRSNLAQAGDFVVINYLRRAAGQEGGGHFSPLAAYDAASDAFLLLDVNPTLSSWVWIPAPLLIASMRTFDTVENRGYVLISRP